MSRLAQWGRNLRIGDVAHWRGWKGYAALIADCPDCGETLRVHIPSATAGRLIPSPEAPG